MSAGERRSERLVHNGWRTVVRLYRVWKSVTGKLRKGTRWESASPRCELYETHDARIKRTLEEDKSIYISERLLWRIHRAQINKGEPVLQKVSCPPCQQKETNYDLCLKPAGEEKNIIQRWMRNVHLKRTDTEKHKVSKTILQTLKEITYKWFRENKRSKEISKNSYSEITEDNIWARKLRNKMREKLEIIADINALLKAIKVRIDARENKVMWVRTGK